MRINEIFYSIQGEGIYSGLPMAFVRVMGCNLRCKWCDTKYAYSEGEEFTTDEIIEQIKKFPTKKVCITGGEPMLQEDTPALINRLIELGYTIYLETNGSISLGQLQQLEVIKISIDIKCPSSGEENKMDYSNLELLRAGDQLKFIIADEADYKFAKEIVVKCSSTRPFEVIFTPVTWPDDNSDDNKSGFNLQKLAEIILDDGLRVRILPQLHKLIWPERTRGV
jgi:7-carboxy-7-deazaguanine synthase